MVKTFKKTIGYFCPICFEGDTASINIFEFSGKGSVEFCCPNPQCREECVLIIPQKDKYKIVVECPICGDSHTFMVSNQAFWGQKLLAFTCTASDGVIFVLGSKKDVNSKINEFADQMDDCTDEYDDFTEEINLVYKIIDALHLLLANNSVECICGSKKINTNIYEGKILLQCEKCHKRILISPSYEALEEIKSLKKLKLNHNI